MISLFSVMLVMLGFLSATLLGFLFASTYRARVVRLTIERMRRTMPLNETEILADKDRLRAEYAIMIHRLETKVEEATLVGARRSIEINRRDAAISALELETSRLKTLLEEHENARRVLEQTVTEKLPKVEKHLLIAKKLLMQRNEDVAQLTATSEKQSRALEEATQMNAQHRNEVLRANAALQVRGSRPRDGLSGELRYESEAALRAEVEDLRAKTREQASMITRLQMALVNHGPPTSAGQRGGEAPPDTVLGRLQMDLVEAESALRTVKDRTGQTRPGEEQPDTAAQTAEMRKLKAQTQEQSAEIARLKAALETWEAGEGDLRMIKDSKMAMKVRLSGLEAQMDEQTTTIQSLRAELAAANERLARQAAHYRDEMRRIGVGTLSASGVPRSQSRPPLTTRIADQKREKITPPSLPLSSSQDGSDDPTPSSPAAPRDTSKISDFLKALSGAENPNSAPDPAKETVEAFQPEAEREDKARTKTEPPAEPVRRPRLLERITGLEMSKDTTKV